MEHIFSFLVRLAEIVIRALEVYEETPEGHGVLNELLSDIEDSGFDIPFWEPDQEESSEPPLDLRAMSDLTDQGVQAIRDAWLKRHAQPTQPEQGEGV